jgi:hypothetical protein
MHKTRLSIVKPLFFALRILLVPLISDKAQRFVARRPIFVLVRPSVEKITVLSPVEEPLEKVPKNAAL